MTGFAAPGRRWVVSCAAAEAVGMGAAAGAARAADQVGVPAGIALVLAGGLVEGVALGLAQGTFMRARFGASLRWWILVTVIVAGLGWAGGSIPTVVSRDDGAAEPSWALVLAGAGALGLVMGALIGAAQALVLRPVTAHPWRWVAANAWGWAAAMAIIFGGATAAAADWSWPVLVAFGVATGAIAGTALGLVTARWLPRLGNRSSEGPQPIRSSASHGVESSPADG